MRQLGDDQSRPPSEGALGADDVGVHVVSDIEQLRTGLQLQQTVKVLPRAPLEDAALPLQKLRRADDVQRRAADVVQHAQVAARRSHVHAEQLPTAVAEEGWLAGADDDHVEEVDPAPAVGPAGRLGEEVHHHVGVVEQRVCEEEGALARAAELLHHRRHVVIGHDVPPRVLRDLVLDDAVVVAHVHGVADVGVDRLVRLLLEELGVFVQHVHQLRVQGSVHQLEERVDIHKVVVDKRRGTILDADVLLLALFRCEQPRPVVRDAAVLVAVHLDNVPPALVDDQTAPVVLRVVRKVGDTRRVAVLEELCFRAVER
mmetsp:Transcript_195/g.728  ORF Transcript_195/g.728 Transcript_195/m.728 type:complete len:315 (-) Transcript_195:303-1247(-)